MSRDEYAVGIDASLTGLAMCVIDPDDDLAETVLPESAPSGFSPAARIHRYQKHAGAAVDWLARHVSPPGHLLIEGYSHASRGQATLTLAEFGAIFRVELLTCGYDVLEISPSSLKKFATGKGIGKKAIIVSKLANRYRRDFSTDDEADAFGLAKMCRYALDDDKCKTAFEREQVEEVMARWSNGNEPARKSKKKKRLRSPTDSDES